MIVVVIARAVVVAIVVGGGDAELEVAVETHIVVFVVVVVATPPKDDEVVVVVVAAAIVVQLVATVIVAAAIDVLPIYYIITCADAIAIAALESLRCSIAWLNRRMQSLSNRRQRADKAHRSAHKHIRHRGSAIAAIECRMQAQSRAIAAMQSQAIAAGEHQQLKLSDQTTFKDKQTFPTHCNGSPHCSVSEA